MWVSVVAFPPLCYAAGGLGAVHCLYHDQCPRLLQACRPTSQIITISILNIWGLRCKPRERRKKKFNLGSPSMGCNSEAAELFCPRRNPLTSCHRHLESQRRSPFLLLGVPWVSEKISEPPWEIRMIGGQAPFVDVTIRMVREPAMYRGYKRRANLHVSWMLEPVFRCSVTHRYAKINLRSTSWINYSHMPQPSFPPPQCWLVHACLVGIPVRDQCHGWRASCTYVPCLVWTLNPGFLGLGSSRITSGWLALAGNTSLLC